jgi:hypothetical protein
MNKSYELIHDFLMSGQTLKVKEKSAFAHRPLEFANSFPHRIHFRIYPKHIITENTSPVDNGVRITFQNIST